MTFFRRTRWGFERKPRRKTMETMSTGSPSSIRQVLFSSKQISCVAQERSGASYGCIPSAGLLLKGVRTVRHARATSVYFPQPTSNLEDSSQAGRLDIIFINRRSLAQLLFLRNDTVRQ